MRAATSATFNDVILTLAGAVLRSHLEDRRDLPSKPLVAFVPVSVRSDDKLDTGVNRLSGMLVSLATCSICVQTRRWARSELPPSPPFQLW